MQSLFDAIINLLKQLSHNVFLVSVGVGVLMGVVVSFKFYKSDARGSDEGKAGIMRVVAAVAIGFAMSYGINLLVQWLSGSGISGT